MSLHEAAHAVPALLLGIDFDSVTLPQPGDTALGLNFTQYAPEHGEPLVHLQAER